MMTILVAMIVLTSNDVNRIYHYNHNDDIHGDDYPYDDASNANSDDGADCMLHDDSNDDNMHDDHDNDDNNIDNDHDRSIVDNSTDNDIND